MPAHSHFNFVPNPSTDHTHRIAPWHTHNHHFDHTLLQTQMGYAVGMDPAGRLKPIGSASKAREDEHGLHVKFQLDTSDFERNLKKLLKDKMDGAILYGVGEPNDMDLFPDITAPRGGLRFTTSKESSMPKTKLKTPTENIERKDLVVALRLIGYRDTDELMHAVALTQELEDNQAIYRAYELALDDVEVVGSHVKVDGSKASGILSDVVSSEPGYPTAKIRLVVAGKLIEVDGLTYVVVSNDTPQLGDDTLRVVQD
jgi:hypothetical protein